jgi:hypothetical protein
MAYYRLEPLGEERQDWHAALIASVLANVWRDTKKQPRPFPVEDFLLEFGPPKQRQTGEQMEAMMMAWVKGHNEAQASKAGL